MSTLSPEAAFGRLIEALGPYREDVVILGGWASRLYDFHPAAQKQTYKPLMTMDADIYVRQQLPGHDPKLDERLKAVGFKEELTGESKPAISKYTLPEAAGFYVEFLSGRTGPRADRDGNPNTTLAVAGVTAQQLDHMHLARFQPWQVGPLADPSFAWPADITANVVNPTCYMAQKVLTFDLRSNHKRGKDILHIHDVLMRFSNSFQKLAGIWQEIQQGQQLQGDYTMTYFVRDKDLAKLRRHRQDFFEKVTSYHNAAASEASKAGRVDPPTPAEIVAVLKYGFDQVFGSLW